MNFSFRERVYIARRSFSLIVPSFFEDNIAL